jgi:hypothetical protein
MRMVATRMRTVRLPVAAVAVIVPPVALLPVGPCLALRLVPPRDRFDEKGNVLDCSTRGFQIV